ncbi:MAG: ComEC/Rec2 family competence protein [Planctomycetota bacterium]|jgi:ComEC/Rec2-related protein|nr:ComEC/Rec2 family competence protein [Planctomycetota bacterium]
MLACRPMLCFAAGVMLGAVAMRIRPELAERLIIGWLSAIGLFIWLILTPAKDGAADPANLPEGYAGHILPRPGFFARRGMNRSILIFSFLCLLAGATRQWQWGERAAAALRGLPDKYWFNATFQALGPSRVWPDEKGVWLAPVLLVSAEGNENINLPARLGGPEGLTFLRGDLILTRVRRERLNPPDYPGAFNLPLWLEKNEAFASFGVARPVKAGEKPFFRVIRLDYPPVLVLIGRHIDSIRGWAIGKTLEFGGTHGNLLSAMLYGYRHKLDVKLRDAFRRVGIGHVLAISGLHVGLVVGLLWWVGGWFGLAGRIKAAGCLVISLVYLGLAGGQVAAFRATMMACIHFLGIIAGRRGDMLNSLGAAALFLTFYNPASPMDISFQLSFTAMIFIHAGLGLHPGRRRGRARASAPLDWRSRLGGELSALARLSLATWIGLFPIIALVFNQVNLIGLLINIAVIPAMSVVLAGGLLLPWLGWIPGVSRLLVLPADFLVETAFWADRLPWSSFSCHRPEIYQAALFYAAAALFLLRGMFRDESWRRRWRNASGAMLALSFAGLLFGLVSEPPPPGGRISHLPGRGFGSLIVEAEDGDIAILGSLERSGLNQAGWLHSLKRSGRPDVIVVGGSVGDRLSSLSFHYELGETGNLEPTIPEQAGRRFGWRPVRRGSGIRFAYRRDLRGRLLWLAAKTGDKSVCIAPYPSLRQLEILADDAARMNFRLLCLGLPRGTGIDDSLPEFAVPVAVMGWAGQNFRPGWFSRRDYGAVRLEKELTGFDGVEWRLIPRE